MNIMKTFKDLEFLPHQNSAHFETQANIYFENGYGISVITGNCAYTDEKRPYEVGVLYQGMLTYNTHITDDVLGYQTEQDVENVMKQIQELS